MAEADELDVSLFVIAGVEPLTRLEIMDIARGFPHIVILQVTNGLLLDTPLIERLKAQRNTLPILIIEGNQAETDETRGRGVHERLQARMGELRIAGILFSPSFTVSARSCLQTGCTTRSTVLKDTWMPNRRCNSWRTTSPLPPYNLN